MTYTPKPGSAADRAISYLGRVKGEVSTSDLADAIACTPYGLGSTLGRAVDAGLLIKRQHKAGTSAPLFWSLPAESVAEAVAPKPEPATDIPVVQRTVPAAEAGPSGWTPHPLDAAWHPRANGRDTPEPGTQQVLKAEPATADATDRGAPDIASPGSGPVGAGQPADAGPAGEPSGDPGKLRVALWNDGELIISRPSRGLHAMLTRDETRELVRYLDSISLDSVRGEAA